MAPYKNSLCAGFAGWCRCIAMGLTSFQAEILKQVIEMRVVVGVVIVDILFIFGVEAGLFPLIALGVLT